MTDVRRFTYDGVEEPWIRKALFDQLQAQHDALYLAVKREVAHWRERAEHFKARWDNPRLRTEVRASERGSQLAAEAAATRLEAILDSAGEKREIPAHLSSEQKGAE